MICCHFKMHTVGCRNVLPNFCPCLWTLLTDFRTSFTGPLCGEFAITWLLNILLHLIAHGVDVTYVYTFPHNAMFALFLLLRVASSKYWGTASEMRRNLSTVCAFTCVFRRLSEIRWMTGWSHIDVDTAAYCRWYTVVNQHHAAPSSARDSGAS